MIELKFLIYKNIFEYFTEEHKRRKINLFIEKISSSFAIVFRSIVSRSYTLYHSVYLKQKLLIQGTRSIRRNLKKGWILFKKKG